MLKHNRKIVRKMRYNKEVVLLLLKLWVEVSKKGGEGHHSLHTHWNGHISSFIFCSRPHISRPKIWCLMMVY